MARPKSSDPLITRSVCLTEKQWAWLDLWFTGGNFSLCLRELLDRAMKFWPSGPGKFR